MSDPRLILRPPHHRRARRVWSVAPIATAVGVILAGCAGTVGEDGRVVLGLGVAQVAQDDAGEPVGVVVPDPTTAQQIGQIAQQAAEVAADAGGPWVELALGVLAAMGVGTAAHSLGRHKGWDEKTEEELKAKAIGGTP